MTIKNKHKWISESIVFKLYMALDSEDAQICFNLTIILTTVFLINYFRITNKRNTVYNSSSSQQKDRQHQDEES